MLLAAVFLQYGFGHILGIWSSDAAHDHRLLAGNDLPWTMIYVIVFWIPEIQFMQVSFLDCCLGPIQIAVLEHGQRTSVIGFYVGIQIGQILGCALVAMLCCH